MPLSSVFKYITDDPTWVIIGGPNDSGEGRDAHEKWPNAKIIGIEPDKKAIEVQYKNKWPADTPLIHAALSDKIGQTTLYYRNNDHKHATIIKKLDDLYGGSPTDIVDTVTLDYLDTEYGPFEDAVLWLDIEGGEYLALLGARKLLERGAIRLINVEMICALTDLMEGIPRLMKQYGFSLANEVDSHGHHVERVYVLP